MNINWHGKTDPTVTLINDNRRIKIKDYSWSFVPFNWICNRNNGHFYEKNIVRAWLGVMTKCWGAVLGNVSKNWEILHNWYSTYIFITNQGADWLTKIFTTLREIWGFFVNFALRYLIRQALDHNPIARFAYYTNSGKFKPHGWIFAISLLCINITSVQKLLIIQSNLAAAALVLLLAKVCYSIVTISYNSMAFSTCYSICDFRFLCRFKVLFDYYATSAKLGLRKCICLTGIPSRALGVQTPIEFSEFF